MTNPAITNSTINSFRDCIQSTAKTQSNSLFTAGVNDTYQTFQTYAWTLAELFLGITALREQLTYLRQTQQPNNLNITEWLARIATINTLLSHIIINTNECTDNKLVSEIITPSLPYNLRDSFDLVYSTNDTMAQMTRALMLLSNREQHCDLRGNNRGGNSKNNTHNNSNNYQINGNNNNENGRGKTFENE